MTNQDNVSRFKDMTNKIDQLFPEEKTVPELKMVKENMEFEKETTEKPIKPGILETTVFGYETWDANAILKGNYWRRSIYTTDKLCKLFLKADLGQKKKYLRKRNPMGFNMLWLVLIIIFGMVALLVIIFLLPALGGVGGII